MGNAKDDKGELPTGVLASAKGIINGITIGTDGDPISVNAKKGDTSETLPPGHKIIIAIP